MKQFNGFFSRITRPGSEGEKPTPESVETQARAGLQQLDVATSQWSPTTRYVGIAILVVIILVALRLAAPIIPLAFLTFVFSFLFFRPVGWLSKRVNQPWVRSLALFYAIVAVAAILGILLIPKMIDQLNEVIAQMGTNTDQYQAQMQTSDPSQATVTINGTTYNLGPIAQTVKDFVNGDSQSPTRPYIQNINLDSTRAAASAFGSAVGQWLGQFLTELVTYTGVILFSLLITFFTLSDWPHQRGVLNKWLPATFERDVLLLLKQIEGAWFGFFKGDMIMGVIMTVISWVEVLVVGSACAVGIGRAERIYWDHSRYRRYSLLRHRRDPLFNRGLDAFSGDEPWCLCAIGLAYQRHHYFDCLYHIRTLCYRRCNRCSQTARHGRLFHRTRRRRHHRRLSRRPDYQHRYYRDALSGGQSVWERAVSR